MIVLGLMAALSGVIAFSVTPMLGRKDPRSLEESLVYAVQEARFYAAQRKEVTQLFFQPEQAQFEIRSADGSTLQTVTTRYSKVKDDIEWQWFIQMPAEGFRVDDRPQRREVDRVQFAPDRSESPFTAEWELDIQDRGSVTIDPFSGRPFPQETR